MVALASLDDLQVRLGRQLTPTEQARADKTLEDVSGAVRAYTGRNFTAGTDTYRVRARGDIRLPQTPVTSVTSVKNIDGDDVDFTFDGIDLVTVGVLGTPLNEWELYLPRNRVLVVDVEYVHGYATVPSDIVGVVCQIAGRALGSAMEDAGIVSESIEGYNYTRGGAAGAGAFGMLPNEREVLDRYRTPRRPISMVR